MDTIFDDEKRKGAEAPDPLKSDLGRTDDVPPVNADASPSVPTVS